MGGEDAPDIATVTAEHLEGLGCDVDAYAEAEALWAAICGRCDPDEIAQFRRQAVIERCAQTVRRRISDDRQQAIRELRGIARSSTPEAITARTMTKLRVRQAKIVGQYVALRQLTHEQLTQSGIARMTKGEHEMRQGLFELAIAALIPPGETCDMAGITDAQISAISVQVFKQGDQQ